MLADGTIDVGLVPVAVIPNLNEWHIVTIIVSVQTVMWQVFACLVKCQLKKSKKVSLDYQSRTSVNLCKILLKHLWRISPLVENAKENYIKKERH